MCISPPVACWPSIRPGATVDLEGRVRRASTLLLPDVAVGDHVLVAAGTVIRRLDASEAAELAELLAIAHDDTAHHDREESPMTRTPSHRPPPAHPADDGLGRRSRRAHGAHQRRVGVRQQLRRQGAARRRRVHHAQERRRGRHPAGGRGGRGAPGAGPGHRPPLVGHDGRHRCHRRQRARSCCSSPASRMASAPTAAFIHKTLFLWVIVLAIPFLGERLGWFPIAAIGVLLAGQILVAPPTGVTWGQGETLILARPLACGPSRSSLPARCCSARCRRPCSVPRGWASGSSSWSAISWSPVADPSSRA